MNRWFQEFLNANSLKKEQNYTALISQSDSISDGINHLPMPGLYRKMISYDMEHAGNINGYTQSAGHPLLVYGIQYFERVFADMGEKETGFADYVRVTAGATAAIQMCISFFTEAGFSKKVLIVGMSYYLFMKSCRQNGLDTEVVCSPNGLCPKADELCSEIARNQGTLVILTQPANPTGERYSSGELDEILQACVKNNCMLLLDLCQYDELFVEDGGINKAILENKAQENVVLINSFSKIRAIAGARIGYVVTQNALLADYIEYCNEMLYFNHSLGYENAIIADLFYRTVLRLPAEKQKRNARIFRNIVLQTAGISCYQNVFQTIFHSEDIIRDACGFQADISNNMSVIQKNYRYCRELLRAEDGFEVSKMGGGYNFCVKIPVEPDMAEEEAGRKLSRIMGTGILTQQAFCRPAVPGAGHIWIRISAAMEEKRFRIYIDKLKEGAENGLR